MKISTFLIVFLFTLKLNSQISSLDYLFLGAKSHKDSFAFSIIKRKILIMREPNIDDRYWSKMRAYTSENTDYYGADVDSIEIIHFHSTEGGAVYRNNEDTVISYKDLICPNLKIFLYVSDYNKLIKLKQKIVNDVKNTLDENKIKWSYFYDIKSSFLIEDKKTLEVFNYSSRSVKTVPYLTIWLKDCK